MRVIDDEMNISINRGDVLPLELTIPLNEEENYVFKVGDVVRFAIYGKKKMNEKPFLEKIINVTAESEKVNFTCTSEEMKFGEMKNKPIEYWYEVELNGNQTIIGYDDEGPTIITLYPEGMEVK